MKGLVVGGSNGIGASIVSNLLERNYEKVYIVDRCEPIINDSRIDFVKINLINFDTKKIYFADVDTLIITAGIGRLNYFETFSEQEIESTFKINAIAPLKIINAYYKKLMTNQDFYCAIISSIAGLVNSPLYALYSASKSSLCKFCDAINTELQSKNISNRILNIAPGRVEGTKFHGGENDLSLINDLSNEILNRMFKKDELFIPNFEVYQSVLERNYKDSKKFGIESLEYKLKNNTELENKKKLRIGYMSGTFDLFHIGHLNILKRAKENCDYLIVGVHKDASHKGKETFISYDERLALVSSCKFVDKAILAPSEDSDAYEMLHYDFLFVGSDYKGTERFKRYEEFLKGKAKIIYFDYTKTTSSTEIRNAIKKFNS